jgi:hypothetical protein
MIGRGKPMMPDNGRNWFVLKTEAFGASTRAYAYFNAESDFIRTDKVKTGAIGSVDGSGYSFSVQADDAGGKGFFNERALAHLYDHMVLEGKARRPRRPAAPPPAPARHPLRAPGR